MNAVKTFIFCAVFGVGFVLCLLLDPPDFIQSERRPPARFPAVSIEDIGTGEFMDRFGQAATDNFPFRESLRTLRAGLVFGAFLQTDKNGLYTDEYGIGKISRTDGDSVRLLTEKINALIDELPGMNIYYSFIPDKSYYAGKKLPGFDAEAVRDLFTVNGGYISLTEALDAGSFYRTDLHWNQVKLHNAALTLAGPMMSGPAGFMEDGQREAAQTEAGLKGTNRIEAGAMKITVTEVSLIANAAEASAGNFQGVYAGQLALPAEGDEMLYLENPSLEAWYLNAQSTAFEPGPVYDAERFAGTDPYDIFLRGAQPLVVIKNKAPLIDRELFIFRDSFSSSLAPLLAAAYRQVTLIDLRYIDMPACWGLVEMPAGSDALFLYSSQVLNNAGTLLI